MKKVFLPAFACIILLTGCNGLHSDREKGETVESVPFVWDNASIYFLLTDRFCNADPANDVHFNRTAETALLRGFEGGDFQGITKKIREGYFDSLGVNVLWFSPVVEQIHGLVDEGTGPTYGFHGYWARDWTSLEPNFGTEKELRELVSTAHRHGIRILMDVVLNHTGPVTERDPLWPGDWVRTGPPCRYDSFGSTVSCTLVENLPDIRTERNEETELPPFLLEKWEREGRLERELAELDAFFKETGYPRAPKYYLIKWIIDLIRDYGVDGFRVDTAKHVEESVWAELRKQAERAFSQWKKENPGEIPEGQDFYLLGEVYNYGISSTFYYDFGDRQVNYFAHGFSSLINFEFKHDATRDYEGMFSKYSGLLNGELEEYGVVNYVSSHDDGYPYDRYREKPLEAGTRLLLCPGTAQIYYGDETARSLDIPGAEGDASLRSFMNWEALEAGGGEGKPTAREVLEHWRKLGRFRAEHPAVGAGVHRMISEDPYLFIRTWQDEGHADTVLVGLDLDPGRHILNVEGIFENGSRLQEYYSDREVMVNNGRVSIDTASGIILLGS
ncbi:MAG TPA: alpha-amlyase [Bacteroidetes bacterium]|nr:alpha-amlyase [Bacteroidota bacterium]